MSSAVGRMAVIRDAERGYVSVFDRETGLYLRTGEPFAASFPELLDVGIMGRCERGLAGECSTECYQSGPTRDEPNMALDDFIALADQCAGRTFQFALGGRGDPNRHERFPEILRACRERGIVPNFTTSGRGLTADDAALCRNFCGAVAVSWYGAPYTMTAIRALVEAGIRTNVHFVLSSASIDEAVALLRGSPQIDGIDAVIFLLHKPVGLGSRERVLSVDDPRLDEFFSLAEAGAPFRVGFDSCSVPALVCRARGVDADSFDTCEGARWSAYVAPDMKIKPCSFCGDDRSVDLHRHTVEDAWRSEVFESFRCVMSKACPNCPDRAACMGGCPVMPEITLCSRSTRTS